MTGMSHAYALENFACPILAFKIQFSSTCEQLLFELPAAVCTVSTWWFVMCGDVFCIVLDQFFHMPFWPVKYLKNETKGMGSYGKVCKAMFDQLSCSAKLLQPVLFQFNNPHSQVIIQQFEEECEFLSEIWYPHVVQYLGVARDPESGHLILLMELLDESLTQSLQ